MRRQLPYFFLFILFVVSAPILFFSCDDFEGDQTIPSYIRIDTITLLTDQQLEGTAIHNITDAWVYIDDELIGAFEMPCTFPVLKEGHHEIKVLAGIKQNGIASTRVYYPFYETWSGEVSLVKDSITLVQPSVRYKDDVSFAWMEDFEDGGSSLEITAKSDTQLYVTSEGKNVCEGHYAGIASLGDSARVFEAATSEAFNLPHNLPVFLEMNFRNNNVFTVGILGLTATQVIQQPILALNHASEWKKVYINLTPYIGLIPDATEYKIFIGTLREDSVSQPWINFDNIKLLHL